MGKNNIYFGNDIANGTGMLVITAKRLPLNSRGSVRPTDEYSSKFDPEGVAQHTPWGTPSACISVADTFSAGHDLRLLSVDAFSVFMPTAILLLFFLYSLIR